MRDAEIQIGILAGLVEMADGLDVEEEEDEDESNDIMNDTDQIVSLNTEEQAILISHSYTEANKDSKIIFKKQREGFAKDFIISKS